MSRIELCGRAVTFALLWSLTTAMPVRAQQSAAQEYFTDVVLIDQSGEELRFYSDVLKGKVVVIDTFFSTCTGICPVLNGRFAELQKQLGEQLGRELFLVSITVDPEVDTPARLKAYAAKLEARPGWIFLTGRKENVEFALSKLGQAVAEREAHSNIVLIGNEPTGLWKKAFGLAPTEELLKIVQSVLDDS